MKNKKAVMLGTSDSKGGVWAVIEVYRRSGFFERLPVIFISTHVSGSFVRKIIATLKALATFCWLLIRGEVSLLHVHSASRASFWRKSLFIVAATLARVPVLFHLHGAEFRLFYEGESGPFKRYIIRFILSKACSIIVLSSQWKEYISTIVPDKNIVVVFNPIQLWESRSKPPLPGKDNLLFLGELGRRKGIFDLLEAFAELRTRFPQARLKIGGNGDIEGVRTRAKELKLDGKVDILGFVAGEDKLRVLAEAAVYVLPSYNEGLPMSVLEAMAAGLPVVTTPVGGIPDAVEHGVEGFLVKPGDVQALTDAITKLLSQPSLRAEMAAAAQRKVRQRFSPERVLPQIEALYERYGLQNKNCIKDYRT